MSFALPFVRSASDEGAEARLAGLGLAAIAIAMFALAAFSPAVLGDGDTFSHLATGEWIIAHGAAPRADPFSHSMPGAPWVAHEWLSEVLMALAFRLGGWSGVVFLTGAAAAGAALIVGLAAARDLRGAPLVATVGLGLGLVTASLLARPHMLALPVAAAWCAGLLAARDRGRAPPLALVLMMTAWANMHGGFIFGLALIGPFALEALVEAPVGARLATARAWTLFGLAALAAALVNPYGVEALILPFRLIGDREPVADQRVATAGLQPSRNDGARAPDADRRDADPAVRDGADPRRAGACADRDGAAAFAPSGAAWDTGADAAREADRGGARRRPFADERRRVATTAIAATVAAALAIAAARLLAPVERVDGSSRRSRPSRRSRRTSGPSLCSTNMVSAAI